MYYIQQLHSASLIKMNKDHISQAALMETETDN